MIRTLNFCLTLLALFLTTFCMAQKSELKFNKDVRGEKRCVSKFGRSENI